MSILGRMILSNLPKNAQKTLLSSRLSPGSIQSKPKSRLAAYILLKYMGFVKTCELSLNKNFPAAAKCFQVFSVGLKFFKEDSLIFFRAFKKIASKEWDSLSRKEFEVYSRMPSDILKVAPVLIIGCGVPLCGFVFIIAYFFPRQMLSYHFWSLQQRSEFALYYHKQKLQCFKPVFRNMQKEFICSQGGPYSESMEKVLKSLGSGVHPSADLILSCRPLFEKPPYGLPYLTRNHVVSLLKLHNMHRGWRRKKRLEARAHLIQVMDAAIIKEGGLKNLTQDEIKWNCFFRGLNPINMKEEDILNWMMTWLSISQQIDKNSYSLLLHCPILLAYNQPSNWWLLHDKRS